MADYVIEEAKALRDAKAVELRDYFGNVGNHGVRGVQKMEISSDGHCCPNQQLSWTTTVGSLFFGTTQQAAGTWGSSASSAANKNDTYFDATVSGVLTVVSDAPPSRDGDLISVGPTPALHRHERSEALVHRRIGKSS